MIARRKRFRFWRTQRTIGEVVTIVAGIGVTLLGAFLGANFVAYGGLCIIGLGVVSILWR